MGIAILAGGALFNLQQIYKKIEIMLQQLKLIQTFAFIVLIPLCAWGAERQKSIILEEPSVRVLSANELKNNAAYSNLLQRPFSLYLEMRGKIYLSGGKNEILSKLGAISSFKGIKYWSVSDSGWRVLITQAFALKSENGEKRSDFTLKELEDLKTLYFEQHDNRSSGGVIYKIEIHEVAKNRVVISVENVTPVKYFLFTAFKAGDVKSIYIFEQTEGALWRYFNLYGVNENSNGDKNAWKAYANRALAMYRYFAKIPTDQEPPLQP
jgi:hypothetical protein